MKTNKVRYSTLAQSLDIDAFEDAIEFEPTSTDDKGNDIGHCPDLWGLHKHGDTTGKFAIHREKKVYNCFLCGGGTLLSLVMEKYGWDEDRALDWLGQFAGDARTNEAFESEIDALLAEEIRLKPVMPYFNRSVLKKWQGDHPWFAERGISDEVRARHMLGFDPEAMRRSRSKEDYVGPGIILPHTWNGNLVGWQTRWLEDDRPKWVPKYTNTGDFPRELTLFNYEGVYLSPDPIVVVESVTTVLFLESLGVAAVATFGSNVSDEQMRLLRKCQQGIIVAPDNDEPGVKYATSLTKSLDRYIPISLAEPPDFEGADLGGLVNDPSEVLHRLESATLVGT